MNTLNKTLLLLLIFVSGNLSSQKKYDPKEITSYWFRHKIMYVILDDDKNHEYNVIIKPMIEKYWKISKYKFITESQYKTEYTDSAFCIFLQRMTVTPGELGLGIIDAGIQDVIRPFFFYYEYSKKGVRGEKIIKLLALNPEIWTKKVSTNKLDKFTRTYKLTKLDYLFMLDYYQGMNNDSLLFKYDKHRHGSYSNNKAITKLMHSKTLILTETELTLMKLDAKEFEKAYGGKVKVVSREELEKIVFERTSGYVYLHICGALFMQDGVEKYSPSNWEFHFTDTELGYCYYNTFFNSQHMKSYIIKHFQW